MKKENKNQAIDILTEELKQSPHFYLADISGFNVEKVNRLRRTCFKKDVRLKVVKNTLLKKALMASGKNAEELYGVLEGPTSIMFSEVGNAPAKIIKEFRVGKETKPILKAAYVQESVYVGDDQLMALVNLRSKNELIADVVALLQSPMKNVISGLQASGGQKIAGLVKTLSEKE